MRGVDGGIHGFLYMRGFVQFEVKRGRGVKFSERVCCGTRREGGVGWGGVWCGVVWCEEGRGGEGKRGVGTGAGSREETEGRGGWRWGGRRGGGTVQARTEIHLFKKKKFFR